MPVSRWIRNSGNATLTATSLSIHVRHLDEGALWVTGTLPASISLEEAERVVPRVRRALLEFPEVKTVVAQLGRPEDGTDPAPVSSLQMFVDLAPEGSWRTARTRDGLVAALEARLRQLPGIQWNFSQPILDNVEEGISGLKGQVAVKLFGDDLATLDALAGQAARALAGVGWAGTYMTGLKLLADRNGIAMPKRAEYPDDETRLRAKLIEMHELAARTFQQKMGMTPADGYLVSQVAGSAADFRSAVFQTWPTEVGIRLADATDGVTVSGSAYSNIAALVARTSVNTLYREGDRVYRVQFSPNLPRAVHLTDWIGTILEAPREFEIFGGNAQTPAIVAAQPLSNDSWRVTSSARLRSSAPSSRSCRVATTGRRPTSFCSMRRTAWSASCTENPHVRQAFFAWS